MGQSRHPNGHSGSSAPNGHSNGRFHSRANGSTPSHSASTPHNLFIDLLPSSLSESSRFQDHARISSNFGQDLRAGSEHLPRSHLMVTFFGSSRLKPGDRYYEAARLVARTLARQKWVGVCTGGGSGIMEAGNLGAAEEGGYSLGIQPRFLSEREHSAVPTDKMARVRVDGMQSRKLLMGAHSDALVFFPGGYGTLDELFEYLTLMQLGWMEPVPVLLYGSDFWGGLVDWQRDYPLAQGLIRPSDLDRLILVDTPQEVVSAVQHASQRSHLDHERISELFRVDLLTGHAVLSQLQQPTITILGSARVGPQHADYRSAYLIAQELARQDYVLITGGGPGIMQAAHLGASSADRHSLGFLPGFIKALENPDLTHQIHVPLHLMNTRKLLLLLSSGCLIFFPGGYGTLDELFESLTGIQIGDLPRTPVALVNPDFWGPLFKWIREKPLAEGMVSPEDLELVSFVHSAHEASEQFLP